MREPDHAHAAATQHPLQGEAVQHLLPRHQPADGDAQIQVGQWIDVIGTHGCLRPAITGRVVCSRLPVC